MIVTEQVDGYKAFNKDMTNRYGKQFEEGKIYTTTGELEFGNRGNGYHFCARLEDTLRYFPAMEEEIKIARVTSLEDALESYDDYYGYYDMYSARTISIGKILTRDEIIMTCLNSPEESAERFVSLFKLTEEEVGLFKLEFFSSIKVQQAIAYYQEHNQDAYSRDFIKEFYQVKQKIKNKK